MGKRIIIVMLLLPFFHSLIYAQQYRIDSLLKLLAAPRNDSVKTIALIALNKEYLSIKPAEALRYAMEAKTLSDKTNNANGKAAAYKGIGMVYGLQGKFLEAIENYEKSLNLYNSIGNKEGVANILSNEGSVYFNRADDAKALELYLRALHIAEKIKDTHRIATTLLNIGAVYSNKKATQNKALDYYFKAVKLGNSLHDRVIVGTSNANIGEIYFAQNNIDLALAYFNASLKDFKGTENVSFALNNLGKVYLKRKEFLNAIQYHDLALDYAKKLGATVDMAQSLLGLGDSYFKQGDFYNAISHYKEAETIARKISNANNELKNAFAGLSLAYAKNRDYKNAYKYQHLLTSVNDSLYNIDTDQKLSGLQFNFDMQKKQAQVDLLTKDKEVQHLQLNKQRGTKNMLWAGFSIALLISCILYRNYRSKIKINHLLDRQNAEIEGLILNIFPKAVAQELQKNGNATPRYYEKASVLFTDFKNFSRIAEALSPQEVVSELNECFIAFDEIIIKYQLEKIKTIGDSYMCAGGVPTEDENHYVNIIKASLEIRDFMQVRNKRRSDMGLAPWEIRIGVNTGPIVAGVVGKEKYAYDIWGGTVNVASRMESCSEIGRVNISAATYALIKHKFSCTPRGKISAKNVGKVDMYFVEKET